MPTDLIADARTHVTNLVAELTGEDDFCPFMLTKGEHVFGHALLEMPDIGDPRNDVADLMIALIMEQRATEAVFAAMTWSVETMSAEDRKQWGNRDFGEHPDRIEKAMLTYAGPGAARVVQAVVTREGGAVTLGEWTEWDDDTKVSGRFADALTDGLWLAAHLTPEMVAHMDAARAGGVEREAVVMPIIRAMRRIRNGDIPPEVRAEAQRLAEQMRNADEQASSS